MGIEADQVPEWFAAANRQDEINIHNIQDLTKYGCWLMHFAWFGGFLYPHFIIFVHYPRVFASISESVWLIPAHLTTLLMTVPKKFVLYLLGEEYEFGKLWASLGEFKELSFDCDYVVCVTSAETFPG